MKTHVKSFLRSFSCAFAGIREAIISERNMRVHIVASFYAVFFAALLNFSRIEGAILAVVLAVVFSAEMFNTAIEKLCDKGGGGYNKAIRLVKDIAGGAVLINAIGSLFIGYCLYLTDERIKTLIKVVKSPVFDVCILISIGIAVLFIIGKKR